MSVGWTSALGPGLVLLSLSGCDVLGVGSSAAVVTVDPTVLRTIHHYDAFGELDPGQPTNLRIDQIECLRATPVPCRVQERVAITVQNTGNSTLFLTEFCDAPLQHEWMGEWDWVVRPFGCITLGAPPPPVPIGHGRERTLLVSVDNVVPETYRVQLHIRDGDARTLPEEMRTSEPFAFRPLPDSPRFVCPTESRADEAARIARQRVADAVAGKEEHEYFATFLKLESRFPGFGGVERGNSIFKVHLEDLSQSEAVIAAVREIWGTTPVVVKSANSFSEILAWETIVRGSGAFRIHDLWFGRSEIRNGIVFQMRNTWRLPDLECLIRGIGMPPAMAAVQISPNRIWP